MAEGKKAFILYCDLLHTVDKLTDEQAGDLFKHILKYVNDQNPTPNNFITEIAFEPVKQQLKRDLKQYEQKQAQRIEAGKRSAELREAQRKAATVESRSTLSTVIVTDTVTGTGNVIVTDTVLHKCNEEKKNKKKYLLSEISISDLTQNQNYFRIALEFQKLIRQNIIELGASTKNIDATKSDATDDIRLLIENDKFTEQDCRDVYNFLKENQFWKKNILSIKKLREKFNKLLIEAKNGNSEIQQSNSGYRKNTAGNNAEDKKRSVDRLADMAEAILQNT